MKSTIRIIITLSVVSLVLGIAIHRYLNMPRGNYDQLIYQYSKEYDLEPELVFAVIKTESNFDTNARSAKNAYGLMQITVETLHWAQMRSNEKDLYQAEDLYQPEINIKYGCCILSILTDEFQDRNTILAAYNAGRGNVLNWLKDSRYSDGTVIKTTPFNETNQYIQKVNKYYQFYKESGETNHELIL